MNFNKDQFTIEIGKAFQIAGISTATDNDILFIVDTMEEDCQQYKTLNFSELLSVIQLGSRKKLNEFFGINVATIHSWIEFYLKSNLKIQYDKQNREPLPELPEITQSQKDEIVKNSIIPTLRIENCHEASLPVFYDFLVRIGVIDPFEGAIKYLPQAKEKIATDLEKEKMKAETNLDLKKVKELTRQIESILLGEVNITDTRYQAKILYMKNLNLSELEQQLKNL